MYNIVKYIHNIYEIVTIQGIRWMSVENIKLRDATIYITVKPKNIK